MVIRSGRLAGLACAFFALSLFCQAQSMAAPAAALGPEIPLAEPKDGFVGTLDVVPDHGPAGRGMEAQPRLPRGAVARHRRSPQQPKQERPRRHLHHP